MQDILSLMFWNMHPEQRRAILALLLLRTIHTTFSAYGTSAKWIVQDKLKHAAAAIGGVFFHQWPIDMHETFSPPHVIER
ncbi:MAG: hypothetical protein GQ533_07230 [Methanosarcinaceae archaeon]|nr:hypothetical protein [Methanosarcinaceae archaeon]